MKIFFSRYQLLRKRDRSVQHGSLLKLVDADDHWGVSDICPWPHLGDLTLDLEITAKGPLYQRAHVLATVDLQARKNQQRLISSKPVNVNTLVMDFSKTHDSAAVLKIKGDQNTEGLLNYLSKLMNQQIRLDFNLSLSAEKFVSLIPSLPKSIEYVEDPTTWDPILWDLWNQRIPLAVDFATTNPFEFLSAWTYLIIKPSRQDADSLIQKCISLNKNFTLTSSMDHPVGFAHGLRYAQDYSDQVSGFSTLNLYEKTEFHRYFDFVGSTVCIKQTADFGIGMTAALNKLNWIQA